jgi:membrane-bound lytic murein transglycosylase D
VVHDRVDCRDIFAEGKIATRDDERTCDRRLIAKKRKVVKRLRRQRRRPRKGLLKLYDRKRKLAKTAYRNVMVIDGRYNFFTKALAHASLYMADVEKVFHGMGLLPELARVSIIESLADPQAVSPAGAVGAYQFVTGTARQYLMVKNGVDERLDPVRGGWAAAHYLRDLHKEFKSWPLALTAYNTGPTRLRKLIKRRRTRDLGKLADRGTSGGFGFDGQNYYAQLVAVVELTSAASAPSANGHRKVFRVDEPMPLVKMAACLETSAEHLQKANPALGEEIVSNGAHVPKGYLLAVPATAPRVETASQP